MTGKENGPMEANHRAGGENRRQMYDTSDYSLNIPPMSNDRLKNLFDLVGELSDYYLEKCHRLIDAPDSDFNQSFGQLIVCFDLQQIYLGRLGDV